MRTRLDELLTEIRDLEERVQEEMRRQEERLQYTVRRGRVVFARELAELHRALSPPWLRYLLDTPLRTLLAAPAIYAMVVPALLLDAALFAYQGIARWAFGIPRVRRADYVILDRHYLKYLNGIERFNCDYCSYFNGLMAYATEVAARTEQYWCPIKHASGRGRHSRAHLFADYGDAAAYRERLAALREGFDDLQ